MMPLCHHLLQLAERARILDDFLRASEKCIQENFDLPCVRFLPESEKTDQPHFSMGHTDKIPDGPLMMTLTESRRKAPGFSHRDIRRRF